MKRSPKKTRHKRISIILLFCGFKKHRKKSGCWIVDNIFTQQPKPVPSASICIICIELGTEISFRRNQVVLFNAAGRRINYARVMIKISSNIFVFYTDTLRFSGSVFVCVITGMLRAFHWKIEKVNFLHSPTSHIK